MNILLVCAVEFDNLVLQFLGLVGGKLELVQIVAVHGVRVIIAELGLDQVRTKQSVRYKGAGQAAVEDVVADLQAELVASDVLLQLGWVGRVELDLKAEFPWLNCNKNNKNTLPKGRCQLATYNQRRLKHCIKFGKHQSVI